MTTRTRTHTRRTRSWSKPVTEHSHAMDLEPEVFTKPSAKAIARSLKQSAERSHTRKSEPFRSAMSMLNFYINRAGSHLSKKDLHKLDGAKEELRKLVQRQPAHKQNHAHQSHDSHHR
jgi:hypothetical protein